MNIIFECRFGSSLYGTSTPNSDLDIKGVYLPSVEEMITNTSKPFVILNTKDGNSSKNTKDDVDRTYYSLQYFLKLLADGQTEAMDMIHCNKENTLITSNVWEYVKNRRSEFYTKNMSAFIGYVKTQASKYGIKGFRLNSIKSMMEILEKYNEKTKLFHLYEKGDFNDLIEKDQFVNINFVYLDEELKQVDYAKSMIEICSKQMNLTSTTGYFLAMLKKYYATYGVRAEQARLNIGVDHKAISHALRAEFQILEIYKTGDLKFPLSSADFLRNVKLGKFHFVNDKIGELIEELYEQVFIEVKNSSYPDKINENLVSEIILNCYKK